ncbi:9542_t:CDS:2, partial [Cetraspora pellucida]
ESHIFHQLKDEIDSYLLKRLLDEESVTSLNSAYSFINLDIWHITSDNSNVAESCHANINRDGKALSLFNAILKKKAKKQKIKINHTEDSSSKFVNEKEYELALKERELTIREKELQLERKSLELAKL